MGRTIQYGADHDDPFGAPDHLMWLLTEELLAWEVHPTQHGRMPGTILVTERRSGSDPGQCRIAYLYFQNPNLWIDNVIVDVGDDFMPLLSIIDAVQENGGRLTIIQAAW